MDQVKQLEQMINKSHGIVFFGGAGVSTASGVPDFRGSGGLASRKWPYPLETMLSHTFFISHTEAFFAFHRNLLSTMNVGPNAAHKKLAEMERVGRLRTVITQNIDGLHQKAGSRQVLELHGNVYRNYCVDCRREYDLDIVAQPEEIPRCFCGGVVRPDVVLYEEMLDDQVVMKAVEAIRSAEVLLVGGTSLAVYPAASFLMEFQGKHLVIVNQTPTPQDHRADLVIADDIARVFDAVQVKA